MRLQSYTFECDLEIDSIDIAILKIDIFFLILILFFDLLILKLDYSYLLKIDKIEIEVYLNNLPFGFLVCEHKLYKFHKFFLEDNSQKHKYYPILKIR